ncbi:MAG TPA: hypothetical protein VLC52_11345, partial [Anaerolineae bacterium]|nr:hypothetical protein [Anaerolineae bacterium]
MAGQSDAMTTADFITTTHRISGQVETGRKPLSDVLNDSSLSYVLAYNVYISRLDRAAEITAHAPAAYLSKPNLSLVVASAREVRGPDRSRFAVVQYQALMSLTGFEVRGTFVGPQRIDLRLFTPAML